MSNYDTSMQTSMIARTAAKILRMSLDPAQTDYQTYERLMLDLEWPILLASVLDNAAVNGVSLELLDMANRILAVGHHVRWTPRPQL